MRSVIHQSVVLPARAERLFEMYLDPGLHSAFTGLPVTIGKEPGAKFEAFEGQLSGHMLKVVEPSLVVQSWRSTNFGESDPDSTLILQFKNEGESGRVELIHLDVPDCDFQGVTDGWKKYYWEPWKEYLERDRV